MGQPMCLNLIGAGHQVSGFDLDADAVAAVVEAGASTTDTVEQLARGAEVVMTSLGHPHQVEAVMRDAGTLAAMSPGSVWVDLTTNDVELLRALASEAPSGVAVVDCPVTGAVDGARAGTLTLFAGGDPDDRARVRPLLECLGRVIDCGPLGTGNVVKLVTNQLWFVHAAALGEGFAVGVANGVELGTLWEAIKASVADSFVARHDAPSIFAGHYDPSFPLDLCLKDLGLIERLEAAVGSELAVTDAARSCFLAAAEEYGTDAGELHVARRIEDAAGLSFRLDGDWIPHWER